jgi:hypothetical protein
MISYVFMRFCMEVTVLVTAMPILGQRILLDIKRRKGFRIMKFHEAKCGGGEGEGRGGRVGEEEQERESGGGRAGEVERERESGRGRVGEGGW